MAFVIGVFVIVLLITGNFYFSGKKTGYSNIRHTISELGETGSAYEKQAGFGLFLPTGILLAVISYLAKDNINAMGLALSLAAGYVAAAFFPCDPGSPSSGTWKQQVHNLGGFIEYAGSIFFIINPCWPSKFAILFGEKWYRCLGTSYAAQCSL